MVVYYVIIVVSILFNLFLLGYFRYLRFKHLDNLDDVKRRCAEVVEGLKSREVVRLLDDVDIDIYEDIDQRAVKRGNMVIGYVSGDTKRDYLRDENGMLFMFIVIHKIALHENCSWMSLFNRIAKRCNVEGPFKSNGMNTTFQAILWNKLVDYIRLNVTL